MKISAEITQHDKFQIEIKTVCPIRKHQRVNDYYVDAFFFLPRNLAINSHTYTGREFYNDFPNISASRPHPSASKNSRLRKILFCRDFPIPSADFPLQKRSFPFD